MAGANQKLSEPGEPFQVTVPKQVYDYLTYLASIGKCGSSIKDVAIFLLTETVNERLDKGWHLTQVPAPAGGITPPAASNR